MSSGQSTIVSIPVAIFGALNKRYVERGDPLAVTGIELAAGTAFLTLLALAFGGEATRLPLPDARDTALLLLLALACTLFPFALSLVALRQLSAFSAQLSLGVTNVFEEDPPSFRRRLQDMGIAELDPPRGIETNQAATRAAAP